MIYNGVTVLTEDPNRREVPTHTSTKSKVRLDNLTGAFTEFIKGDAGRQTRPFHWFLDGRAAINDFWTFMEERKGRWAPFWVPTWHDDLLLRTDGDAALAAIEVHNINYSRHQFDALYTWRRHLAFIKRGAGVQFIKRIDGAVETTTLFETLTLDSLLGQALPKDDWMLSFLTLCRLASDEIEFHWHNTTLAEVAFNVIELPTEMPQVPV
jgi:hypothetical protein